VYFQSAKKTNWECVHLNSGRKLQLHWNWPGS
jgi:hypothetical protein